MIHSPINIGDGKEEWRKIPPTLFQPILKLTQKKVFFSPSVVHRLPPTVLGQLLIQEPLIPAQGPTPHPPPPPLVQWTFPTATCYKMVPLRVSLQQRPQSIFIINQQTLSKVQKVAHHATSSCEKRKF